MGEKRAPDRLFHPGQRQRLLAAFVRRQGDRVVLSYPTLFFEPPHALLKLRQALLAPRCIQSLGQFVQTGFEPCAESPRDGRLLRLASRGVAMQLDFLAIVACDFLDLDRLLACGLDRDGMGGLEVARALAADNEIAIPVRHEPGEIRFGGDAGIHYDKAAAGSVEPDQHGLQRLDLRRMAGKGL